MWVASERPNASKTMILNETELRDKVLACWLGKNIGGTLGAPFEWKRQLNDVSFYTQDLGGEPLPNDDLDIQLLWLIALEERGVSFDAHTLAEYWCLYVTPHWAEYGTAKINMRAGLMPPLCGIRGNAFKHSCGAFIRSEIWACIAPGDPHLAAYYALQDAMLDHGDGEGTYAATFCAAMESAAFVEKDLRRLFDIGLSFVPEESGVARATRFAIECYDSRLSWKDARDAMLRDYRGGTFLGMRDFTSPADWEKGLGDGELGYDAPGNIGLTILALLYGEGDFEKTVCIAVNCGEDTDCTAATAGALFGILHGTEAIPDKWIAPIGRTIKTGCLNLGELGYYGNALPATVDALTERTLEIARQVTLRHQPRTRVTSEASDCSSYKREQFLGGQAAKGLYERLQGPVYRFDFFEVYLDYGGDATIAPGQTKTITARFRNTYKVQANLQLRLYAPSGWNVSPQRTTVLSLTPFLGEGGTVPFTFTPTEELGRSEATSHRFVLEITSDGRPTAMTVPIILLQGVEKAA